MKTRPGALEAIVLLTPSSVKPTPTTVCGKILKTDYPRVIGRKLR